MKRYEIALVPSNRYRHRRLNSQRILQLIFFIKAYIVYEKLSTNLA